MFEARQSGFVVDGWCTKQHVSLALRFTGLAVGDKCPTSDVCGLLMTCRRYTWGQACACVTGYVGRADGTCGTSFENNLVDRLSNLSFIVCGRG